MFMKTINNQDSSITNIVPLAKTNNITSDLFSLLEETDVCGIIVLDLRGDNCMLLVHRP